MRNSKAMTVAAILLAITAVDVPAAHAQSDGGTAPTHQVAPAMPVRSGSVIVKVDDFNTARKRIIDVALAQGGTVLDSRTVVTDKGRRHGWVRLRLSADRLEDFLPAARSVGRLYAEKVGTTEQASEYEELGRRAGRLEEHEGRLDGLLKSPRRLRGSDILYVQERLFRAGVDQSLLEQRRLDLTRRAQTATLTVELFEPLPAPVPETARRVNLGAWYAAARNVARHRLDRSLARGATAGAYATVYAPLWLPMICVGLLLLRLLWVRTRAFRSWIGAHAAPAVATAVVSGAAALAVYLARLRRGTSTAVVTTTITTPPPTA